MFEIFTEDTSSCKEKHNSEEELINVMSVHKNEGFRIDNEECVILNNEIEDNNVKPVTTSLEGRTELFSRNKNINTVNTVENYPPPQTLEENVLEENSWLDDRPLNEIMKIIENNTLFYHVDVLFITGLH
ncbi:50s ribosomal subunit protein l7 l12 50s ribosomal subunit protein l10 fusion [Lasius niger]|uniref:50s ribosomal subunit protein l7 l12 50s ribosomal subunit protein l10 fusion n=1 Tax=Lasius niger TaxID=67767 RepID=A0A0J7K2Y5_LASNI|nr:50s ribosomal subunit protein l7 l12 50s ribosomal subunit protein l10 fusion [Lasius niger]